MIIESFCVENFRVFNGRHCFDVHPRIKYKKKRPIILFGGLNGAGKTTTLTAVRLALYGKLAIGANVSQNEYQAYLRSAIHRPTRGEDFAHNAMISLTFSYASMGVISHYTVTRSWKITGNRVAESLTIGEDGKDLSGLNPEQCQGFLNELIPIGVSDLFFFDGEKIAELAEDTKGGALGESVKKLLGLDLIETLDTDLSILLRNEAKRGSSTEIQGRIEHLENELKHLEDAAEKELVLYEQEKPTELEAINILNKLELELSSKGGAWAQSRESEIKRHAALLGEKRVIEETIQELLAGSYPLSLAEPFVNRTLQQLREEALFKRASHTANVIRERIEVLNSSLNRLHGKIDTPLVRRAVEEAFLPLLKIEREVSIIHDLSDSSLAEVEVAVVDAQITQREKLKKLSDRLDVVLADIDRTESNIARAPEKAHIEPLMKEIARQTRIRVESAGRQKEHIDNYKRLLRDAIGIARQLDKETSNISTMNESKRVYTLASGAKYLLKEFKEEIAKRKVKDLEERFVESFRNLARKEDINLRAIIDPLTFIVRLVDENGNEINKDELSAGEKQIFAIAILEALARTSGRRLPIIIDTPLGRLDSVHRKKLIHNYFPTASHQVIILSTDTEVDESFYSELSPNISHAFRLDYNAKLGCTIAVEGYFWRG